MANEGVLLFLIITSAVFHKCLCFSSGSPDSQCVSMIPLHGTLAQTGESPYNIKVSEPYYMLGKKVKVSIESSDNSIIKGYLIQARPIGVNTVVGMFSAFPANGHYLGCGNSKVKTAAACSCIKMISFYILSAFIKRHSGCT